MKINNKTHRETREVIRKPYQKPRIECIQLVPEEAVLGNCKSVGVFGATGVGCGSPIDCNLIGS